MRGGSCWRPIRTGGPDAGARRSLPRDFGCLLAKAALTRARQRWCRDACAEFRLLDLPCKRGIYIEARDSWVPVAQEAGTYHQMLQMWGVCTYDPMLCQAAEADVNELSYLLMLIEDAILANS